VSSARRSSCARRPLSHKNRRSPADQSSRQLFGRQTRPKAAPRSPGELHPVSTRGARTSGYALEKCREKAAGPSATSYGAAQRCRLLPFAPRNRQSLCSQQASRSPLRDSHLAFGKRHLLTGSYRARPRSTSSVRTIDSPNRRPNLRFTSAVRPRSAPSCRTRRPYASKKIRHKETQPNGYTRYRF